MKLTNTHRCAGRIRAAKHAVMIAAQRAPTKKIKKRCETVLVKLEALEADMDELLAKERA